MRRNLFFFLFLIIFSKDIFAGASRSFDGSSNYIDIGTTICNSLDSHSFSIWIRSADINHLNRGFFHFESGSDDMIFALKDGGTASQQGVYIKTGGDLSNFNPELFEPDSKWKKPLFK